MTRDEILSWADEAWATSTEREGESLVVRLARATLEEAARAVCQGCREMDYNPLTEDHRRQIDDAGNCEGGPCSAVAIHDLIAALDKEGDRE